MSEGIESGLSQREKGGAKPPSTGRAAAPQAGRFKYGVSNVSPELGRGAHLADGADHALAADLEHLGLDLLGGRAVNGLRARRGVQRGRVSQGVWACVSRACQCSGAGARATGGCQRRACWGCSKLCVCPRGSLGRATRGPAVRAKAAYIGHRFQLLSWPRSGLARSKALLVGQRRWRRFSTQAQARARQQASASTHVSAGAAEADCRRRRGLGGGCAGEEGKGHRRGIRHKRVTRLRRGCVPAIRRRPLGVAGHGCRQGAGRAT